MLRLPEPDDLTSLVLRTDFSSDAAWDALRDTIDNAGEYSSATYVSDPTLATVSIEALIEADAAAGDEEALTYVFLADASTMADDEMPLLAVDLYDEPGRT